jgi:hypothetical protein
MHSGAVLSVGARAASQSPEPMGCERSGTARARRRPEGPVSIGRHALLECSACAKIEEGAEEPVKGAAVPLSEHEQRILQEIEKSFYEHDPRFADRVRSESLYRHAGRNCKRAGLAFVAGLAFLVGTFSISIFLGVLGFLVMLASAVVFERNLRAMGKAGLSDLHQTVQEQGFPARWAEMRARLEERFRRSQ